MENFNLFAVMGRNKGRVICGKRDTPMKTSLRRPHKRKRLRPNNVDKTLPEKPGEEEEEEMVVPITNPVCPVLGHSVQTSVKPVLHKSDLDLHTENPRHKAVYSVTPAGKKSGQQVSPARHPDTQRTLDPEAFKGGEKQFTKEEQHFAVTPESVTFSSMETDTTFSFDDDDEEDSAIPSSSSLSSPEIFREETYVETQTFPTKEELLGLHHHIKNSTMLDVSHAETIDMHHLPNFSAIIDASTILAENHKETSSHKGSEAETKIQTDSFKPAQQTELFNLKYPTKVKKSQGSTLQLTNRKPIVCKKKVSFKTPIITETFKVKATNLTIHDASESIQTSSPVGQMKPDAKTSIMNETNSEDDTSHLRVTLKRPVKSSPEKATFFDSASDGEREIFFQRMKERSIKLRSAPVFPLTAAKYAKTPVL